MRQSRIMSMIETAFGDHLVIGLVFVGALLFRGYLPRRLFDTWRRF